MVLLKNFSDLWSVLLRKMGKHKTNRAELPFPTTGIIGAIAGDCSMGSYDFHLVKHGNFDI